MRSLVLLIVGMAFAAADLAVNSWAAVLVWRWFVASTFALAPLTMWQAAGIQIAAAIVLPGPYINDADFAAARERDFGEAFKRSADRHVVSMIRALLILAVAWIVRGLGF